LTFNLLYVTLSYIGRSKFLTRFAILSTAQAYKTWAVSFIAAGQLTPT